MKLILILFVFAVTGCASLNNSGTTRVEMEPLMIDGNPVCCRGLYVSGKDVDRFEVSLERKDGNLSIEIRVDKTDASGVIKERGKIIEGVVGSAAQGAAGAFKGVP